MRIFVNNCDSYVGRALCADLRRFRELGDEENRLVGTLSEAGPPGGAQAELTQAMGVKRIVSRTDHKQYLKDVLSCSLIVYDLHSADVADVEAVIKHLKLATLEHNTTFVLISSVNGWARTKKEYVDIEPEDGEEEEEGEEWEDGKQKVLKKKPKVLSDADADRRIPSPAHESWKYLETLALSLAPKEKLRPHVIAAGVLYGNGETVFNELFKAAWLTQPTHSIIAPGDNYIPCVHVRDVARLVKAVSLDDSVGRYLIAVDKAQLTQAEIVQGIVNQISHKREVPLMPAEEAQCEFKEERMLDLIMKPSAPMQSKKFDWWCKKGLVANIEKVAAEFCKQRNLRPIKAVVIGPPGAGTERFCSMAATKYLHDDPPHLTFDQILSDAMAEESEKAERLRARVEKASSTPGGKLPLKIRTKLVQKRLLSNVCRYRGYVLEGYPESYEEAQALFTKLVPEDGEEEPVEEAEDEEDEEEEEEAAPPEEEEEEDEEEGKPQRKLDAATAPEFMVVLHSSEEACRRRLFSGEARGPQDEDAFVRGTAQYQKDNLPKDGSPSTSDFFKEVAGLRVLEADVDQNSEDSVFQSMCVYMEAKGQFFNYLRSEEELTGERETQAAEREAQAAEAERREKARVKEAEQGLRAAAAESEAERRQLIKDGESALLDSEAMPLRQYLLNSVVPTLSEGLSKVCKEQPDDPIEFLAQYLFAHAQDIESGRPQ